MDQTEEEWTSERRVAAQYHSPASSAQHLMVQSNDDDRRISSPNDNINYSFRRKKLRDRRFIKLQTLTISPLIVTRGKPDTLDVALVAVKDRNALKVSLSLSRIISTIIASNRSRKETFPDPNRPIPSTRGEKSSIFIPNHILHLTLMSLNLCCAFPAAIFC